MPTPFSGVSSLEAKAHVRHLFFFKKLFKKNPSFYSHGLLDVFYKNKKSINSSYNLYLNTLNTTLAVLSNVHYRSYYQNENQGTL